MWPCDHAEVQVAPGNPSLSHLPGPSRSILRPRKSTNFSNSPAFVVISRIVVDYLFVDEVLMIGCRFLQLQDAN